MAAQKPAFFIFDVRVTDPQGMQQYHDKAVETFAAYGGKIIAGGEQQETIEGPAPLGGMAILQFPSMEQAKAWYHSPEYQAILPERLRSAQSHGWLVEGMPVETD